MSTHSLSKFGLLGTPLISLIEAVSDVAVLFVNEFPLLSDGFCARLG